MLRAFSAAALLVFCGTAQAQTPGEFAGSWAWGTQVLVDGPNQYRYVYGVLLAQHQGGDRYSILVKAYEPSWGPQNAINYAEQDCTGVVQGSALNITCTVKAGSSPGYHPDNFSLTRSDANTWTGTLPVGNTTPRMSVLVHRVG